MFEGIVRLTGKTGYIVRGDSLLVIYFLSDHEIVMIDSGYRTVGGYFHYVHTVNISEFFFFGQCSTGHTGFFRKLIEKALI